MKRRKKGFTLIELLVVISIIALLLSILMPALTKVKAQAKNIICSNNLKQLTVAWKMYSMDNKDKLCTPGTRYTITVGWTNDDNRFEDWAWSPFKVGIDASVPWPYPPDPTVAEREEGIKNGALYPYLENVGLYLCLGDKSGKLRSYSMVDCMGSIMTSFPYVDSKYVRYRKQSQIDRPTERIVLLEENDPRGFNAGSFIFDPAATHWNDPLTVWHGGASSFAFADGHAEKKKWNKETVDAFTEEAFGFTPVTDGGIEDLGWMQDAWSNTIEREP